MTSKAKVIEVEGELDEDEPETIVKKEIEEAWDDKGIKVEPKDENPTTIVYQSLRDIVNALEKIDNSQLQEQLKNAENLIVNQNKLFDKLEKLKSFLYDREYIEIQETFALVPAYLKKLADIKSNMKEIEAKIAKIKQKKSSQK